MVLSRAASQRGVPVSRPNPSPALKNLSLQYVASHQVIAEEASFAAIVVLRQMVVSAGKTSC
jgi:hypothetical protein